MSGFFNANKLVKRVDRLELLTMSNSGPAPTPIIPTLQEVTAQANTSDHSIIITGMNGYLPPEDGLVIANAPNFQSAIVYFTDNKDKGSLSFSDAQTSLTFKTDSRGDFRVAISESGVSVQGLLSTGSTIADITEGTEKAVTTKEWVLDKLDGFISSGDNISELNNDAGYITGTTGFSGTFETATDTITVVNGLITAVTPL